MNRDTVDMLNRVQRLGISLDDAYALRRIAMTLHRWFELECGTSDGLVERDEQTGKCRFYDARARYVDPHDPRAWSSVADRETGARKRLAAIMAKYPTLTAYVQTDPRGAALYILTERDLADGSDIHSIYSRGVAVYK